jgi:NAD(P)-dependent dehydrogenase (short-subunit alcohol dehydrogenase family)
MGGGASTLGKKTDAIAVVSHFAKAAGVAQDQLLAGKRAVVTGGNSGIGTETVKALLAAGCTVVFGSRGVKAGEETIAEELLGKAPARSGSYALPPAAAARVSCLQLDLERLESVRAFAEAAAAGGAIDLLVCNAGIMALPAREVTPHGWEKQIGTNHFGHHYLISLLRDKMVAQGTPARIVLVASAAHAMGGVDVADLHFRRGRSYAAWTAYGQSKLANILEAKALADQLSGTKVAALALHPGVIKTSLARHMSLGAALSFVFEHVVVDKTVPQGASTTLFACLEPSLDEADKRGSYLDSCAVATPNAAARDEALRKALWDATERDIKAALAAAPPPPQAAA